MTEMTVEDTRDELDLKPCSESSTPDHRHGSHEWFDGVDPFNAETWWCEGSGLVTVSFSELDTFRQCFMKHELAYGQRWSKEQTDNGALGLGTLWHRVLECHYLTIKSAQVSDGDGRTVWNVSKEDLLIGVQEAVNTLLAEMRDDEKRDPEVLKILKWMYLGHLEAYGLDEEYDIVAVESTAVLTLKNADGSNSWVRLKVKLDLILRDSDGRYWVLDHKSAASIGRDDKDLDWDDQFGLYIAAMRKQGIRIMGAIHSAAVKKPNKGDFIKPGDPEYKASMKESTLESRFKRTRLNRTEPECDSILGDALADTKLAYSEANHKRRHTNPDTCKWRCDFKEACIFGRRTNNDGNVLLTLQRTGFMQEPIRH